MDYTTIHEQYREAMRKHRQGRPTMDQHDAEYIMLVEGMLDNCLNTLMQMQGQLNWNKRDSAALLARHNKSQ